MWVRFVVESTIRSDNSFWPPETAPAVVTVPEKPPALAENPRERQCITQLCEDYRKFAVFETFVIQSGDAPEMVGVNLGVPEPT